MQLPIKDRRAAGRELAALLDAYRDRGDVIVLGLPRGGVPVAYEIAKALGVALDVLIVRKLGVPGHEELAMGAIASGGHRVMNQEILLFHDISQETLEAVAAREQRELERRERAYRGNRPEPDLAGKTVILVDDGLATGATMRAAVTAVKHQKPAALIIAAPVAASSTINQLRSQVNECVALTTPEPLFAISQWYVDFRQTTDDEVRELLDQAWHGGEARPSEADVDLTPIGRPQWSSFCRAFADEHRGWLISLGEVGTETLKRHPDAARDRMRKRVDGVPLQDVAYDPEQDAVLVRVSEDRQPRSLWIGHPIGLYREQVHAADKGIRIDTDAGTTTLVEFRESPSAAERRGARVTSLS